MLQLDERARHFHNEFTLLPTGSRNVRTGARARLLVGELIAARHPTLGGENLRVVVHVLAGDAMSIAGLPPATRAEMQGWIGVRLARECSLLDLLATVDGGDGG